MLTSDFDFSLPDELIAQEPQPRGESRLLVLPSTGEIGHSTTNGLPGFLRRGDLVVVNNTKVLAARLFGTFPTGGRVEILLVEKHAARDWDCLVRPGRKARPGVEIEFSSSLRARVLEGGPNGRYRLRFSSPPEDHLDEIGHVPLPPYIKRQDHPGDREHYQTVYASVPGAIAAPTAGLHFDQALLQALREHGIGVAELTLHVGIGTFKPVTADLVHEHKMDAERFTVSSRCAEAITRAREANGRIVAVGTTVVRALEAVGASHDGAVVATEGPTDIFITPGFRFRVVDVLFTNFHLPRSTLLMLVSAFVGRERALGAYAEAVRMRYRFYSYGDAMLAERFPPAS